MSNFNGHSAKVENYIYIYIYIYDNRNVLL